MEYVLVGDIGGTKIIFSVYDEHLYKKKTKKILTKDVKNFSSEVHTFLKECPCTIKRACFGIAGPVKNKTFCHTTNIPWNVSSYDIKKQTKLSKVILLNDFEALGYSLSLLKKKDLLPLKQKKHPKQSTVALIGVVTGLGMSTVVYHEQTKTYIVLPSEGGHSDFSPETPLEYELYNYLKRISKKTSVEQESVLSGQGLVHMYRFLLTKKIPHSAQVKKRIVREKHDKASIIASYYNDPLCKKTLQLFISQYAKASRNLCLTVLPKALFIGGGIAPKIYSQLKKYFMKEFIKSQKMSSLLKKIPVYVIHNEEAPLKGAAYYLLHY